MKTLLALSILLVAVFSVAQARVCIDPCRKCYYLWGFKLCFLTSCWRRCDYYWYKYSSCTASCDGGTRVYYYKNTCDNSKPENSWDPCKGPVFKTATFTCNNQNCPVDGGWTNYTVTARSSCSETCGNGTKIVTKTRYCTNPSPEYGGKDCQGKDTKEVSRPCNKGFCPIDGGWTNYTVTARSSCSETCGNGTKIVTKTRYCTNPGPEYGGKDCQGKDTKEVSRPCNKGFCPINGGWSNWTDWQNVSRCSALCGGGTLVRDRKRTCTEPAPRYGGLDCEGDLVQEDEINCGDDDCGELCPRNENTYLPDEQDKHNFFQCVPVNSTNYKALLMECPKGTQWSQSLKVCDHETNANSACVEGAISPDPNNCRRYLWCVHGKQITMFCPGGTTLNVETNICDISGNDNC